MEEEEIILIEENIEIKLVDIIILINIIIINYIIVIIKKGEKK